MYVRKAKKKDILGAVELARALDLEFSGMESDTLWVVKDERRVIGVVALKKHADCVELCALGVDPHYRGRGIGKALVEALVAESPGDVYLGTVIPDFFEKCGFERSPKIPRTFYEKKKTSWCEGCRTELCSVMLRRTA